MVTFVFNKENADRLVEALRTAALDNEELDDLADYVHTQSWMSEEEYDTEFIEELLDYAAIGKEAALEHETELYYETMESFLESLREEF